MSFSIFIPTYNGGGLWSQCAASINAQCLAPSAVYVIDSTSSDETVSIAKDFGFDVSVISPNEFNHGGTRNRAAKYLADSDYIVFLTQDVVIDSVDAIRTMIDRFEQDERIAAVYGRQLPHLDANPIATHARLFNYPKTSELKSVCDIPRLGIKTAFMSNSFSAYRTKVFLELGGFPDNTILCEDMHLAAKIVQAGYKVAYCADATVRHSHNYTPWQEFKRYFDVGVFHVCEPWIQDSFGGAGGEGLRYIGSEIKYLLRHAPFWIPRAMLTNICKIAGYKLGLKFNLLPTKVLRVFSMHSGYWSQYD